jgi:hypothetical protein
VVEALKLPLQSKSSKQITQQDATDILQIFIGPMGLLKQFQISRITTIECKLVVNGEETTFPRDPKEDPSPYEFLDITGELKEYKFDYTEQDGKYNCLDHINEEHKHNFRYQISPQGNYLAIQLQRVEVDRSSLKQSKCRVEFAIKKRLTHQDQNVHFKFFMAAIQEGKDSSQGHWTTVRVQANGSMIFSDNHTVMPLLLKFDDLGEKSTDPNLYNLKNGVNLLQDCAILFYKKE